MFSQEELKNIYALIERASISGKEATVTAILQQKIVSLITPEKSENEEPKPKK